MKRTRKHFRLQFNDSVGNPSILTIEDDHYAEQILRGLVHSKVAVTIEEIEFEIEMTTEEVSEQLYDDFARPINSPAPTSWGISRSR